MLDWSGFLMQQFLVCFYDLQFYHPANSIYVKMHLKKL